MRFYKPQAAQLHIYHTLHGLQQEGHEVMLLALQERQVLCTKDLHIFKSSQLTANHFGQLGLSGATWFKWFESGIRRLQTELCLPYFALFDSFRMVDASCKNLQGFDVIHERFNLLALGGAIASKRLGIPFVLEVNADLLEQRKFKGVPERGLRRLFAIWATRFCFKAAAKIICISTDLKDHLRNKWNIGENQLTVIPCAADVEAFAPNKDSTVVRQELGLTNEPVIVWVGGFYIWHDLDLLLDSFAQVLQKRPDARLVLVGDGQTRSAVAQKASQNGLGHAVIMTGAVPHTSVPAMVSIADIAVVPSAPVSAERGGTGTPLKLFEYMAAGKAIIATALNHATAVIQDGCNGLIVEAGDVNGFAEAILTLLGDSEERNRLGQNARQHAIARHSWEQYTKQLEATYRDVLA